MSANPLTLLIRDASDTVERMRADARHLRELGQRAKVGARVAGAQLRAKIDRTLEGVADGVLELERALARAKGRR